MISIATSPTRHAASMTILSLLRRAGCGPFLQILAAAPGWHIPTPASRAAGRLARGPQRREGRVTL
jgi:hypothetical protein